MKNKMFKVIFTLLTLACSQELVSQTTTTITYDVNSGLSTTKCNVFDPPVAVGGKTHTGVIGGASYSDANGLKLPTDYTLATNKTKRTDYKISYEFKAGYSYVIKFTAFANVNSGSIYPRIGAALFTTAGLTYTSTTCVADDIAGFPVIGSLFVSGLTNTSTEYTPPNGTFISPFKYDYLLLEAYMGSSTSDVSANVYIKEIKIIETAPVSFTLSPTSTTLTCGSTNPITFTVTNGGNTTGVTGHTWNLGSANNGWLYNGSAAPATITTGATVNAITLTPVCGSSLSNISATVAANGVNYTTNSSTVSITQPELSINGDAAICSGTSPYFINNLPCNATVSWQANPVGLVTFSCSTCPLTNISSSTTGEVTLTATVTNVCGQTFVRTKTIALGLPYMSNGTFTKNGQLFPLAIYNSTNTLCQSVQSVVTGTWQSANSVVWTGPGYSHPSVWQDYGFNNTTKISTMQLHIYQTPGTGFWTVTGSNGCGSRAYNITFDATSCSGSDPDPCTYYRVSPNPSKNGDIVIISKPPPIECPPIDPLIDRVNIYDQNGTLIQTKMNGKATNTSLRMPTTRKGFVIVEIISGKHTEKHKIIVQ